MFIPYEWLDKKLINLLKIWINQSNNFNPVFELMLILLIVANSRFLLKPTFDCCYSFVLSFLSVIGNVAPAALQIILYPDQVKMRLIQQLITEFSRVLQILLKC